MSVAKKILNYKTLKGLVTRLRDDLNDNDFILLYAYNGTGKTRTSMAFKEKGKKNSEGIISLCRRIIQTEGPTAIYAGFFANLSRILPNTFLMFALYEQLCYMSGLRDD